MYYISPNTSRIQREALITAMPVGGHFREGLTGDLQAAVPTDLLCATCRDYRVWILRSGTGEQEGKWVILGKALLLGEPDLIGEAKSNEGKADAVVAVKERTIVVDD
jgi:hypothetical protein